MIINLFKQFESLFILCLSVCVHLPYLCEHNVRDTVIIVICQLTLDNLLLAAC